MRKVKVLKESKVSDAFEVVTGFNYPDGKGGEKRIDVGKKKPTIVFEKDFEPKVWKSLNRLQAVRQIVEKDGESVEVINGGS